MEYIPYIASTLAFVGLIGMVFHSNKSNDNKVGGVYKRLDGVKKNHDETYTRKDMCEVLHKQLTGDVLEIKNDVKQLLRKNGIS